MLPGAKAHLPTPWTPTRGRCAELALATAELAGSSFTPDL
jgi:hypothetical protein